VARVPARKLDHPDLFRTTRPSTTSGVVSNFPTGHCLICPLRHQRMRIPSINLFQRTESMDPHSRRNTSSQFLRLIPRSRSTAAPVNLRLGRAARKSRQSLKLLSPKSYASITTPRTDASPANAPASTQTYTPSTSTISVVARFGPRRLHVPRIPHSRTSAWPVPMFGNSQHHHPASAASSLPQFRICRRARFVAPLHIWPTSPGTCSR